MDSLIWKTEDDGSLRGEFPSERAEFVLKKPIALSKVENALDELIKFQEEAEFKFSHRCSVHVHINVGDLTHEEFLAFLYLSLLVEESLMNFCGEERQGNHFCLRINDAEGYVDVLRQVFGGNSTNLLLVSEDAVRYAAINIASVRKYGSLEFRGMRGTLDKGVLIPWIKTLYRLKSVAKKLGSPSAVHDFYVSISNQSFAKRCFGVYSPLFFSEATDQLMSRSYSLTLDLPMAYDSFVASAEAYLKIEEVALNKRLEAFQIIYDEFGRPPAPAPRIMDDPNNPLIRVNM